MTQPIPIQASAFPDPQQDAYSKATFGFWVYLMTDCILFATLFTTFAVLHHETFGGPSAKELFSLSLTFSETIVLLVSSFACGLAMLAAHRLERKKVIAWFFVAFILGISFLVMELSEFTHLVNEGNSWKRSAFLSSYFTLVGTHGAHVTVGLFWMAIMMLQVFYSGVTAVTLRRLTCLSMFWHFLDIIWIFVFSVVYLMGEA